MSRYWSSLVEKLDPYVPGEQPRLQNLVKLNTNEHPYGPSPKVIAAITAQANDSLRLYPDPTAQVLRQAIATRFELTPEQVFVGNGSDEVLAHVFQALLKHMAPLVFPDITYSVILRQQAAVDALVPRDAPQESSQKQWLCPGTEAPPWGCVTRRLG